MSTKRGMFLILVAGLVVSALVASPRLAGRARALPLPQETAAPAVTIPYPGRLSDDGGQPVVDGVYDFAFTLFAAEAGGEPLWSEVQGGVAVQAGAFAVSLGSVNPIPAAALAAEACWLAVAVRGPGETAFTALAPRQRVSPASPAGLGSPAAASGAAAGSACPHDHLGALWSGSIESDYGLNLQNYGGTGLFVYGTPYGVNAWGEDAAVLAKNQGGVAV